MQLLAALAIAFLAVAHASEVRPEKKQGAAGPPTPARSASYHIGYRILTIPQEGQEPLVVALWYPTDAGPGKMTYQVVGSRMVSDATRDAAPAKGPFPLVIYSHGGGGCAIMGAAHAEALAENGFVVAGPDHHDEFRVARSDESSAPDPRRALEWLQWAKGVSAGAPTKFAHRPAEVRATINYLLARNADPGSDLKGLLDPAKIGVMGVSFGAWTTQVVAGFIPAFRDDRIKAAVPIAGRPGRMAGGFENVTIPLMMIFGEQETLVLLDPASGSKTEGMMRDYERHLDFGGAGVSQREQPGGEFSTAQIRAADPVIGTVNRYCLAFFRRYLLDDPSAEAALAAAEPNVFLLKSDPGKAPAAAGGNVGTAPAGTHKGLRAARTPSASEGADAA
jgi:predicted dienelactone hydrolase